jgi:hypothetical protein
MALRKMNSWAPATAHFRGIIAQHGKGTVDARVQSFLGYYKGDPAAAVVDAVLSVRWNWTNRVAPGVKAWIAANPNRSLTALAATGPGPSVGNNTPRPAHVAAIMGVAQALLQFGPPPGGSDSKRFATWARQAEAMRFNHVFDPVGAVNGIGPALFNYLLMRAGVDALKPDKRIRVRLVAAGLLAGISADDRDVLFVGEAMAEELGVDRLWFDQLLW